MSVLIKSFHNRDLSIHMFDKYLEIFSIRLYLLCGNLIGLQGALFHHKDWDAIKHIQTTSVMVKVPWRH